MNSTLVRLGKGFDLVVDAFAVIAAVFLGLVMIAVSVAIVSRYFFGNPMAWVIELAEYALLYSTFLGSAWLLRQDGHIKVDIVLNALSASNRSLLNAFNSWLGVVACLALLWYSAIMVYSNYERGLMLVKTFDLPKFVPLAIIPVGALLLTIQFVRRAIAYHNEIRLAAPEKPLAENEPATESI